jgi:hypothetical protein
MRLIVCLILVIAFIYYFIIYPIIHKGDKNLFMTAVIILILIPTGLTEYRWLALQNEASTVVAEISGNTEGHLNCQRISETWFDATQNLGEVRWDDINQARLKYNSCTALFSYMQNDKQNPTPEEIIAVHVLSHESGHVSGDMNEASTECVSMQNDSRTAQLLGATAEQGSKLSQTYWTDTYPRMRSNYVSADCTPDGTMDKTPGDGIFP